MKNHYQRNNGCFLVFLVCNYMTALFGGYVSIKILNFISRFAIYCYKLLFCNSFCVCDDKGVAA